MSLLSGKKLLLLGFIVVLIVAIPLTVYLVQQQQKTKSGAAPSTTLSFNPQDKTASVGDTMDFDMMMDPGSNQVSFVKVLITYDSTKLATAGAGLVPNTTAFPSVLQGPIYGSGTIAITLSIGGSPQNIIQTTTKIATLTLKALATTDAAPTKVSFGTQTQVLSISSTDKFNENVISTTNPASVTINAVSSPTVAPTAEPTAQPTAVPTAEPTAIPTNSPTPEPTLPPDVTATPTTIPTESPTATPIPLAGNQVPVCNDFSIDGAETGTAPYALTFSVNANDSDGTIDKLTFNFGDGTVQDITEAGGLGTNSISVQQSHTYAVSGTFTATAVATDNTGAASDTQNCSKTITVNSTEVAQTETPTPTIAPTGPSTNIIIIGILGTLISVLGIILLLAL